MNAAILFGAAILLYYFVPRPAQTAPPAASSRTSTFSHQGLLNTQASVPKRPAIIPAQ